MYRGQSKKKIINYMGQVTFYNAFLNIQSRTITNIPLFINLQLYKLNIYYFIKHLIIHIT